jgi:hypothetical protein
MGGENIEAELLEYAESIIDTIMKNADSVSAWASKSVNCATLSRACNATFGATGVRMNGHETFDAHGLRPP